MNRLGRRDFVRLSRDAALMTLLPSLAPASASNHVLTVRQRDVLTVLVDVLIPRTETPGACDAGVPLLIQTLLADWASKETRREIRLTLDSIDDASTALFGHRLIELDAVRRNEAIESYDHDHIGLTGTGYPRLKELVLLGFYHSKIGATEDLRYLLVPGAWRGCAPLSEIGRAWA